MISDGIGKVVGLELIYSKKIHIQSAGDRGGWGSTYLAVIFQVQFWIQVGLPIETWVTFRPENRVFYTLINGVKMLYYCYNLILDKGDPM